MRIAKGLLMGILCAQFYFVQGQNVQNVDVDFLSDQQIREYWQRAQRDGYSIEEVRDLAISRGMKPDQATLLVERITELFPRDEEAQSFTGNVLRQVDETGGLEQFLTGEEEELNLTPFEQKLFGYSLFQSTTFSFNPNFNMPTPKNYILGTGDELLIEIYGASQQSYSLKVSTEGRVSIPLVGPVNVGGLSIGAVESRLRSALSRIYQGLSGPNPSVFMELALGDIKTIRVNVIGDVRRPGIYAVPSFANVFNVLYASGGPTTTGTFRAVEVYRDGKKIETVDIYDFLLQGDFDLNISLRDDDIVLVKPYGKQIEITGEVRRPGIYELTDEEGIDHILQMAGGFRASAVTNSITIERLIGSEQLITDVTMPETDFSIQDGDRILVRKALDPMVNMIQIEGAVLNPGPYGWNESATVKQLISKAGGLLPEAYTEKVNVFRRMEDMSTEILTLDLQQLEESGSDVDLQIGDMVYISSKFAITETSFVQVSGDVFNPGIIPFYEKMTISDAIILASGLKNSALGGSIELVRRPENPGEEYKIQTYDLSQYHFAFNDEALSEPLEVFDHIFIRTAERYFEPLEIEVNGEVNRPGKYILDDRETKVSDIIERCNGLTEYAYPKGAYVLRRASKIDDVYAARMYLRNIRRLSDFLKSGTSSGTISEEERMALSSRIRESEQRLKNQIVNSGRYPSDTLLTGIMDSLDINQAFQYDKIAISLDELISGSSSKEDLILRDGDKLFIPYRPQTVKVSGAVLKESTVTRYLPGKTFGGYIGDAGGYDSEAKRGKAYVLYANGTADRSRGFLFFRNRPKIEPGCEIVIPGGKRRERFDIDRIFSLVTTTATTYLLILTVADRQQAN